MSDNDLINIARIGIDAEAFSKSDFGKFLVTKAQREIDAAINELIDADSADWKANNDIRNKIHVARMFLTWMEEAIQVGRHAHAELQELDNLS